MLWRYGKRTKVLPARPLPVWTKLFRVCTVSSLICKRCGREEEAKRRSEVRSRKNDEARMTNDEGMTKHKSSAPAARTAHSPTPLETGVQIRGALFFNDMRSKCYK